VCTNADPFTVPKHKSYSADGDGASAESFWGKLLYESGQLLQAIQLHSVWVNAFTDDWCV